MIAMGRPLTALVVAAVLTGRAALAQSIEASASTFTVQNHMRFAGSRMEQSGQWFGGEASIRLGMLRAGLGGAFGSLTGSATDVHPDRRARTTSVSLHLLPKPWIAAGLHAEAKRFDTDVAPTVWRLLGVNLQAMPTLSGALQGLADVTYWPAATVFPGEEQMPLAFRAILGATYHVGGRERAGGGRLGIRFAYRFERFDFESQDSGGSGGSGAGGRLEQFRGATLGAVLRLGL